MRKLFLFLFLLALISTTSFSKTDIYFANGILTTKPQADRNTYAVLQLELLRLYGSESEMDKHIGDIGSAYNSTLGPTKDLYESYLQLLEETTFIEKNMVKFGIHFFNEDNITGRDILNEKVNKRLIKAVHDSDIRRQISQYKSSLDQGNSVIVIAHSQGTLFTNEAYKMLEQSNYTQCKKGVFNTFFVAPAASKVLKAGNHTPSIVFDNDPIFGMAFHFGFQSTINPNKYWKKGVGQYGGVYNYKDNYKGFHAFSYYMGQPLNYTDAKGVHTVSTDIGKYEILSFIASTIFKQEEEEPEQPTVISGAIETTLSWTCASEIDMNLDFIGDMVIQDVKDIENLGLEHAYVPSRSDLYPGSVYVAEGTGDKRAGSQLEESYLEDNPIDIYAVVKTPSGSKFKQWKAKNFGQLTLGKFAEIEIKDKTIETTYTYNPNVPVYDQPTVIPNPRPYVRTYNECDEADKKYSCQCVPCEYIIHGMDGAVEYGPIGGADVEIVRADT